MKKALLITSLSIFVFAKSVDFREILDLTITNNKELQSKKLSIQESQIELEKAKALDFGKLDFNSDFIYSDNAMYSFANKLGNREASFKDFGFSEFDMSNPDILNTKPRDLNYPDSTKSFENSISYELPIFTGFKITYAKEMAKLKLKAIEVKYQRDKNLLAFEVLKAYNLAVANRESIKALKSTKEATKSFVKLSKALYEEGIVTKIDTLQATRRDSEINSKLIEAKNRYKLSLAYLEFLSDSKDISDVKEFKYLKCKEKSLEFMQEVAIKSRLDLKSNRYLKKLLESREDFEKSKLYPQIGFSAKYGFSDDKLSLNSDKDFFVVGTNIKYNLFNGGSDSLDIEQSKIATQKMSLQLEHFKRAIELEVKNAYLNVLTQREIVNEKLKSKELANEVLQKAKEMYKNGLISMSELLLKEAESEVAKAELIEARFKYSIIAGELKLATEQSLKGE